jgi:hypothetical protein
MSKLTDLTSSNEKEHGRTIVLHRLEIDGVSVSTVMPSQILTTTPAAMAPVPNIHSEDFSAECGGHLNATKVTQCLLKKILTASVAKLADGTEHLKELLGHSDEEDDSYCVAT